MNQQRTVQQKSMAEPASVRGLLQRACACGKHTGNGGECAECRHKREGMLQRAAVSAAPATAVPPIVHEVLRSPGQPLDAGTRGFMEPRFGHDFSGVRVHTDARAAESARAVNALAYTVGRDVVFGAGQHTPGTSAGQRLMAHELAHVVQQKKALGLREIIVDVANTRHEQMAQETAKAVISGSRPTSVFDSSLRTILQRQSAPPELIPEPTQPPLAQEDIISEDLAKAGLVALGQMLQSVVAPEAHELRDLYNKGAARILQEKAKLIAKGLPEAQIAEQLSNMRHELALNVRKTGSALLKKGAEVFDAIRGNPTRPTYETLRAAGKTNAEIIESAAKTNRFINQLPSGLRWTGRGLWFVQAGISVYLVVNAPPEKQSQVAEQEIEGIAGGIGGAAIGSAFCIGAGIATEGVGLIVCGLLGGIGGAEGARRGHLLQILDIAPHHIPELAGRIYRIDGVWDEIDLLILSIPRRTLSIIENILVVATGQRSGELVSGRGHYRKLEVTPANQAAEQLFGSTEAQYVAEYLLHPATRDDFLRSRD